jgi:hypothetical protein
MFDTRLSSHRIPGDCYRVDDQQDWRPSVFRLCRSLPLIVLDVQSSTPAVREELSYILGNGYLYKTLFLGSAGEGGSVNEILGETLPDDQRALVMGQAEDVANLLWYLLHERGVLPSREAPVSALCQDLWPTCHGAPQAAQTPAGTSTRVRSQRLGRFGYTAPPGWEARVMAEDQERYAVLLRPPTESGSVFRRRSRLDLMVFRYTADTIRDEAAFRRATLVNLSQRGCTMRLERVSRRHGVMAHECYFSRGEALGYLCRFIVGGKEYLVHWTSLSAVTFQRHLPDIEQFLGELETGTGTPADEKS